MSKSVRGSTTKLNRHAGQCARWKRRWLNVLYFSPAASTAPPQTGHAPPEVSITGSRRRRLRHQPDVQLRLHTSVISPKRNGKSACDPGAFRIDRPRFATSLAE